MQIKNTLASLSKIVMSSLPPQEESKVPHVPEKKRSCSARFACKNSHDCQLLLKVTLKCTTRAAFENL
jgi:hypothetical protein